jgi:hypothetical protein
LLTDADSARPRESAGGFVATAWGVDFRDYATLGRVRTPTRAEVYWELPARSLCLLAWARNRRPGG